MEGHRVHSEIERMMTEAHTEADGDARKARGRVVPRPSDDEMLQRAHEKAKAGEYGPQGAW